MAWHDKPLWTEGLFLRPAHLQQQVRHVERWVERRCQGLHPHGTGFTRLVIDPALLRLGKLALLEAEGILPDGTPFCLPQEDAAPAPLDIGAATIDQGVVHLALPVRHAAAAEIAWPGFGASPSGSPSGSPASGLARYLVGEEDVADTHTAQAAQALLPSTPMQVARLHLRLLPASALQGEHVSLPVARIVERREDGSVVLDERHLPPALDCRAVPALQSALHELQGLLQQRADTLAARVAGTGRGGLADVADFLLLQLCNRAAALFQHLAAQGLVHPERLHAEAVQLAGELATFTRPDRRPATLPPYRHDDLQTAFEPLMSELRRGLGMVAEPRAVALPLVQHKYGIRVGQVHDRMLLTHGRLVLAAQAHGPAETLRQRLPAQAKVGAVDRIRDLVNLQLPGVPLRALPVAPRELPYHAGCVYFELERGGEAWQALERAGGLALHVSGDHPGLELALWAIRAPDDER